MSSFSVLGAPSKQIFGQVQPVSGVWDFRAEASQGTGLAGCNGQWQGSSECGQATGEEGRRCVCSARSEVLTAAVLGLAPQSRRREQGWSLWGEQSGSGFGVSKDSGQGGGSRGVEGYYVTEGVIEVM